MNLLKKIWQEELREAKECQNAFKENEQNEQQTGISGLEKALQEDLRKERESLEGKRIAIPLPEELREDKERQNAFKENEQNRQQTGFSIDKNINLGALLIALIGLLTLIYIIFGTQIKAYVTGLRKPPPQIVGQDGAHMMLIPAGEFQMGSNDHHAPNNEQPVHTVYLDAFYMDVYEVTNAQYKAFVLENPQWQKAKIDPKFHNGNYLADWEGNTFPSGHGNRPVVYVSWYAAMAYAEWAGKRLPTEAEWEKAARGGLSGALYPWGDTIDTSNANYDWNVGETTPIGRYAPNGYGLHDVCGNVWEWCLDEYSADFYASSSRRNPFSGGTLESIISIFTSVKAPRVLRGGSWDDPPAAHLRTALRSASAPETADGFRGFRCVKPIKP